MAVSSSIPAAELKVLLKDSLVEIFWENPLLLLHPSEDAGSGSCSGKLSRQCLVFGSLVFACCFIP